MKKTLDEGQIIKYVGSNIEIFDVDQPLATFLGYDSNGWDDIWIEYKDQKFQVSSSEIEIIES